MTPRDAVSEDLRRLGVALVIAAMVGGLLQDLVPGHVAVTVGALGLVIWAGGVALTRKEEDS